MVLQYFHSFERDYQRLSKGMQTRVDEAIALFERSPRHPSLRIKKMKGKRNIWEGRVTRAYRFLFEWEGEMVTFRRVGPHDILGKGGR